MGKAEPALHQVVVVVDVEGFSSLINATQLAVRDDLYAAIGGALARAGIESVRCVIEDRGDGALILVGAQVPKAWLISRFAPQLAAGLARHNERRPATEWIRLRMALHAGEVHRDPYGVAGHAVNHAFRLVSAPALKASLGAHAVAVMALIVSDWFYQDVVRHDPALEPSAFDLVRVNVKETSADGWIRVLDGSADHDPDPAIPAHPTRSATGGAGIGAGDVLSPTANFTDAAAVPRQVPPDVAGFTGRTDHLALLDDLAEQHARQAKDGTAVVISAIAGTAGVGKTALAVHWAHRMSSHFPDGQLYVNLRGYDPGPSVESAEALANFLGALGIDSTKIPIGMEERAALYRSLLANRRILILLDNAATERQVRPLLPGVAGCMVLVTSRSSLAGLVARDGAQRISLDILMPAEAIELITRIIGRERVDAEPAAAAALANRCSYLPLALRIAAERAVARPQVSLSELASELATERQRLDTLTVDTDELSQVRSVFSWSYNALSAPAKRMFRLLGLHTGPEISLSAAAALAGASQAEVRVWMDALAGEHLLQQIGPERYQLHDLLRAYAIEQADTDPERSQAVCRLLDWYLHTAEAADRHITSQARRLPLDPPRAGIQPQSFESRAQALNWCEIERSNLVAATRYAFEHRLYSYAWRIPATPWGFFNLRKYWDDWITTHQIALAATHHLGHRQGEAWILCSLGLAYTDLRQFDTAIGCYQDALAISRDIGDRWAQGWALGNLATAYRAMKRPRAAVDCHGQALIISRETGDRWGEGWTLHNLAHTYSNLGQQRKAIDYYQQALAIRQEIGDRWGEGWTLHNLGDFYNSSKDFEKAINSYRQALFVSHEIGDRWSEVRILRKLGQASRVLQLFDEAIDCFRRALSLRQALGDKWGAARTLADLGQILYDTGRPEQAIQSWHESLKIFDELGDPHAESIRAILTDTTGRRE